jgi:hypothetical protein
LSSGVLRLEARAQQALRFVPVVLGVPPRASQSMCASRAMSSCVRPIFDSITEATFEVFFFEVDAFPVVFFEVAFFELVPLAVVFFVVFLVLVFFRETFLAIVSS